MAKRRQNPKGLTSETLPVGSEFVFDFYCQVCKDEDRNEEANGFCVNCREYLCEVCYTSHQRTRQTRHHKLLDKDQMPKDKPLSHDPISRDISSLCKHHTEKTIEFYCKSHDFLGCITCFATVHRRCPEVESILERSKNIGDSQEYTDFIHTLKSLDHKARDIIAKARENTTKTTECHSELLKSVKRLREDVLETLNKLESSVIAEAEMLVSNEKKQLAAISNTCNTVTGNINTVLSNCESLQSARRVCQMYISMKENSKQIRTLQDNVRSAEAALSLKTFMFEPSKTFQDFMENPNALWKISTDVKIITDRQQATTWATTAMKPKRAADIPVKIPSDRDVCYITGSALLANNKLLIVDNNNSKVKLFDTQTNKLMSELETPKWPWDVAAISRNTAAVALPRNKKILILNVSNVLSLDREVGMDGDCRGVAYSKGKLVVTYYNPAKLEIMDLYCNVMKSIENDNDGSPLFTRPGYVCVSNNGLTIYVSDYYRNKVFSLTFDGVVMSVYIDRELEGPSKVCVDHHDNVYVCGRNSRNVHMLTTHLVKLRTILTKSDGLGIGVYSISLCQEANRLYLGMWERNNVKVFQLS